MNWSVSNPRFDDFLCTLFPDEAEREQFLTYYHKPVKKSLSINTTKMSVKEFFDTTSKLWWHLTDSGFFDRAESFYVDRDDISVPLGKTFLHQSGFFYLQEIAASSPVHIAPLKPNAIVLDMSASPWWKSFQLAQRLRVIDPNQPGIVVSNEFNKNRLMALQHNLNRTQSRNTAITCYNGTQFWVLAPNFFDLVLVDAPCSWEWTGFKSDSAQKFWRQEEIKKIAWIQHQLLVSALKTTKPWGYLLYSTCTLNPYENEQNIESILQQYGELIEIVDAPLKTSPGLSQRLQNPDQALLMRRYRPHKEQTWWFFVTLLRKKAPYIDKYAHKKKKSDGPSSVFRRLWGDDLVLIKKTCAMYGIDIPKGMTFCKTPQQIYAVPELFWEINEQFRRQKIWLPVFRFARSEKNTLRPFHHFGTLLGDHAQHYTVDLSYDQAQSLVDGADINLTDVLTHTIPDHPETSYCILKRNGYGIGIGKIQEGIIKNKYPVLS